MATSCLHLHHHGGLPRDVDLLLLCVVPRTSQRHLYQIVEEYDGNANQTKRDKSKQILSTGQDIALGGVMII